MSFQLEVCLRFAAGSDIKVLPVVTACTDQDSTIFTAHVHLAYACNVRLWWFPGPAHLESNVDTGMMTACGLDHLAEKVSFLAKFNHGPFKGGRWLGVQRMAVEAFLEAVEQDDSMAVQMLRAQIPAVCDDQGWAGPDTEQAWQKSNLGQHPHLLPFVVLKGSLGRC